jgi:hypothetical protein
MKYLFSAKQTTIFFSNKFIAYFFFNYYKSLEIYLLVINKKNKLIEFHISNAFVTFSLNFTLNYILLNLFYHVIKVLLPFKLLILSIP